MNIFQPPITTMLSMVTQRKTPDAEIKQKQNIELIFLIDLIFFLQSRASNTAKSTCKMNIIISTTIDGIIRRFVSPLGKNYSFLYFSKDIRNLLKTDKQTDTR